MSIINGDNNADFLLGSPFDDVIKTFGGDDHINAGAGNDEVHAGSGNDNVFGNQGNDTIFGGSGNDTLRGAIGDDELFGGKGNDILDGGAGRDIMTGGSGHDVFDFNDITDSSKALFASDLITDFKHGVDKIDLHDIDANTGVAGNQDFHYVAYDVKHQLAAGEVTSHYEAGLDRTIVEVGNDGSAGADMRIALTGDVHLNSHDFVL